MQLDERVYFVVFIQKYGNSTHAFSRFLKWEISTEVLKIPLSSWALTSDVDALVKGYIFKDSILCVFY